MKEFIKPNFRKVGLFVLFYVNYYLYFNNFTILDVVSLFPLYFSSCLLIQRYDLWRKRGLPQRFGLKNCVMPDMRKIIVFLVVWFVMPFPIGMFVDPGGFVWTLMPLSGPLLFFAGVLNLVINGGRFYSPSTFVDIVLWLLVYPSLSYFLGCLILYTSDIGRRWLSGRWGTKGRRNHLHYSWRTKHGLGKLQGRHQKRSGWKRSSSSRALLYVKTPLFRM